MVHLTGAPADAFTCHEVCKLLQCGSEVVYPERLNGGLEPIWVSLPTQSVRDAESTNEPAMLQINLPSTTHRGMTTSASQQSSMPISSPHSVTECLRDTVTRPSMEEEVEKLLSGSLSNTPEQSFAPSSPGRPPSMVPNTPAASKDKAPPDLGEIIPVYQRQPPPSP